jgi:hypothetical protein
MVYGRIGPGGQYEPRPLETIEWDIKAPEKDTPGLLQEVTA